MILANTRQSMTRDDAQLAIRLLTRLSGDDPGALERRMADEGIDAVLDDPRLAAALLQLPAGAHVSLPLFCYVMVRQCLRAAGEEDCGSAHYVTSIVVHFGMSGRANRIGMAGDETYSTLVDLV